MADKSKIKWTDSTWNPITGCSVVSAACKNCYAMKLAGTRLQHHPSRVGLTQDTANGPVWTGEVRFNEGWLDQPLRWKKPRKIFVCAHSDLFHESVPNEWIDQIFAVMALAPQHTFQVLTKRPGRMLAYLSQDRRREWADCAVRLWGENDPDALHDAIYGGEAVLPNVWLGVTVENQDAANERIPLLLQTPAAVRWVSMEPLLGSVSFRWMAGIFPGPHAAQNPSGKTNHLEALRRIDWVVVGGESGPNARPMHPDWVRSLRDQCVEAGVPFFFKQWGEWHTGVVRMGTGEAVFRLFDTFERWVNKASTWVQGGICLDKDGRELKNGADMMRARDEGKFPVTIMHRVGTKASGNILDGQLFEQYPEVAA